MSTQLFENTAASADSSGFQRPLRICMMDILPTVPYYTASLSAALQEVDGVDLSVECIRYYLDPTLFLRLNIRTDRTLLDIASRFRKASAGMGRIFKFAEYLINLSLLLIRCGLAPPDVLHVQFLPTVKFGLPVELWFLRAARALGCKIVYTVHNVLPQDTGEKYRALYWRIYHMVDRLICHDECAKTRLTDEFHVRPERVTVIPHGPLLQQHSNITSEDARRRLGIAADEPLILWQGILRPYKGVSFLLQAWEQVQRMGIRGRLIIAGNGDANMVEDIRHEAKSLGLRSSVTLDLRFISVEDLVDYYTAADILAYPYREVTTSGALMTGIGYGKAIVATDHAAFRNILKDGENALIVPYGDVGALAESIFKLIQDRSLRTRLAAGARAAYARTVQWSDIASQTMACYQHSIGEKTF
jgi:glycosyltransferase involved in cell wall biosynthesis